MAASISMRSEDATVVRIVGVPWVAKMFTLKTRD